VIDQACEIKRENPASKFKILSKLGAGAFGTIYKVINYETNKHYALKYSKPKDPTERQDVINECSLIKHLDCEQLIKCEGVWDFNGRIWVILELMEGGSLTNIVVERKGNFSEDFVRWSLYQVAKGLAAMHSKNVLHRDIKSDNILCRPNGDIKLADLGFSIFLSEQLQYRQSQKGTPSWVSPEIAAGVSYSKEVDVWSYGCFAYEILTSEPPHH